MNTINNSILKRALISIFALFFSSLINAQTDGISYQAIIINNNDQEIPGADISGNYLSEGTVILMFTIIDAQGSIEYQETKATTTDKYGMVSLVIGQGNVTGISPGMFDEISWDGTPKQLSVSLSYGGNNFEELSSQELLFVPYAYHRNITATGTLIVDGESMLNSDLTVSNQSTTNLTGDLVTDGDAFFNGHSVFNTIQVENESVLNGSLEVYGIANFTNQFNVLNGNTSYLTGDLIVDGLSTFNSDALFNSNISVMGNSAFNSASFGSIVVTNESILNGLLNVGGLSTLSGGLNVANGSETNLSGSLNVENNANFSSAITVNSNSNLNGQVIINADINGPQTSLDAYPLRVQGSNQGIAIRLDGSETQSHNFATFLDGSNTIHGRIEGQSIGQLRNSFRFIWDVVMGGLNTAFIAAEGVACSAQLDFGEAGVMAANYITLGAQWIELTNNYESNAGVAFVSGGADYSEWIEKENQQESFMPGEVVGIKGGKISKNTSNASHILVISTNPIVIGNLPKEGNEENYEKVGFLGQVPTRVVGKVNLGDYIIASGNNDGLAIAFSPKNLPTRLFDQIIGVAWEESQGESIDIINVAIGLNSNDLSSKIENLENELSQMKEELASLKAMIMGEEAPLKEPPLDESIAAEAQSENKLVEALTKNQTKMSDTDFENWLRDYSYLFVDNMELIKAKFEEENVDYKKYPEIARIVDNPVQTLRDMHSGEFLPTLWNNFEKRAQIN